MPEKKKDLESVFLEKIKFKEDFGSFKKDTEIEFNDGMKDIIKFYLESKEGFDSTKAEKVSERMKINVIVGDNGSGKSRLLANIVEHGFINKFPKYGKYDIIVLNMSIPDLISINSERDFKKQKVIEGFIKKNLLNQLLLEISENISFLSNDYNIFIPFSMNFILSEIYRLILLEKDIAMNILKLDIDIDKEIYFKFLFNIEKLENGLENDLSYKAEYNPNNIDMIYTIIELIDKVLIYLQKNKDDLLNLINNKPEIFNNISQLEISYFIYKFINTGILWKIIAIRIYEVTKNIEEEKKLEIGKRILQILKKIITKLLDNGISGILNINEKGKNILINILNSKQDNIFTIFHEIYQQKYSIFKENEINDDYKKIISFKKIDYNFEEKIKEKIVLKNIGHISNNYVGFPSNFPIIFSSNLFNNLGYNTNDIIKLVKLKRNNNYIFECNDLIDREKNSIFYRLSSGEKKIIVEFTSIINYILENKDNINSFIFLIDEPDLHLHLDWQKQYIQKLVDVFGSLLKDIKDISLHFIIATHSPFLLSDVPAENVILLQKDGGYTKVIKWKNLKGNNTTNTFGANFVDLINDGFFFENKVLMGSFAENVIGDIAQKRREEITIGKEIKNKKEIEKIEDKIGDSFLKDNLLYFKKKDAENGDRGDN